MLWVEKVLIPIFCRLNSREIARNFGVISGFLNDRIGTTDFTSGGTTNFWLIWGFLGSHFLVNPHTFILFVGEMKQVMVRGKMRKDMNYTPT